VLTTSVTQETAGTVIHLAGELDMETAPRLAACIDDQLAGGPAQLVINLKDLTFCDSRGIATLISAAARCQQAGGLLHLAGASGNVARVLDITGVGELFASDTRLDPGFMATPHQRTPHNCPS
jgi:anti-sigma B factor antagonist